MFRLLLGLTIGFAAGYLFGSERARAAATAAAQQRLAAAPEPIRQAAQNVGGVVDRAPIPPQIKDRVTRAANPSAIIRPNATEVASRPPEPLPRQEP